MGCHECALRCAGDISMCRWEWERVRRYLDRQLGPAALRRLLAQDKTIDLGDGVLERHCLFYDTERRLCAIYPVRPLACRLMGHAEFFPCPIGKVERWLDDAPQIMQDYAELELKPTSAWLSIAPPRALREQARAAAQAGGRKPCRKSR